MANAKVQVRRVYEDLAQSDGTRCWSTGSSRAG